MTTQRITNEEELQQLLNKVAEYARFNFGANLTAIKVLEGAKDMMKVKE